MRVEFLSLSLSLSLFWAERSCKPGRPYGVIHVRVVVVHSDPHSDLTLSRDGVMWSLDGGGAGRSAFPLNQRILFKPRTPPKRQLVKAAYLSHHAVVVVIIIIVIGVDVI